MVKRCSVLSALCYISIVLHAYFHHLIVASRVPQICKYTIPVGWRPQLIVIFGPVKNQTTHCVGLSIALFLFSVCGNLTYVASILFKSLDRKHLIANSSWLVGECNFERWHCFVLLIVPKGSGGTILLDMIVSDNFKNEMHVSSVRFRCWDSSSTSRKSGRRMHGLVLLSQSSKSLHKVTYPGYRQPCHTHTIYHFTIVWDHVGILLFSVRVTLPFLKF
jgi:hypothetical protein